MTKKFKIEGEDFNRIKVLTDKIQKVKKDLLEYVEKSHNELWNELYKIKGVTRDKQWTVDVKNEDLGFYIIEEQDNPLDGLLKHLQESIFGEEPKKKEKPKYETEGNVIKFKKD